MHIIAAIEVSPQNWVKVHDWLDHLGYPRKDGGTQRVIQRELKLFDFTIPEENAEQFMADLARFRANFEHSEKGNEDMDQRSQMLAEMLGLDPVDLKELPEPLNKNHPKADWMYAIIIGTKKDPRNKEGKEMV